MKKKKNINIIDKQVSGDTAEISKAIKITIGVLIFFLVVYLLTGILTGDIKLKKDKEKTTTIQYTEILAEMTFKQKESEYYVLYYDFDNENDTTLLEAIDSTLSEKLTTYKVDLSKKFNSSYVSDSVNKKATTSSELKIKNPTLIKIKDKSINKIVTGLDEIEEYALSLK